MDLRSASLMQLSQELGRFNYDLLGKFRCPTCLNDFSIESREVSEEHIIPASVGGSLTTFLCKDCNSLFGSKQTKWLGEWIDLNEGKAPFPADPKKQKARLTANDMSMGVSLRLADDGAMEVIGDRSRSDPRHYDELSQSSISEILLSFRMPVFQNEGALSVGFLTAAYGLWFKSFGYSWVLQKALNSVRAQILNPEQNIISWNYLIEVSAREIKNPRIGLAKIGEQIFPCALIYDHLVLLPSVKEQRPAQRAPISSKAMDAQRIEPRFRHCCHGPSSLICDGQDIISPDMFPSTTVPIEQIRCKVWS